MGVWADSSGAPGALLLDAGAIVVESRYDGWATVSGLTLAVTLNTYYWIGWNANFGILTRDNSTVQNRDYRALAYGALSDPYGTPDEAGANGVCMRAGVEASGATNKVYMIFES
jgi:hypothetical protein